MKRRPVMIGAHVPKKKSKHYRNRPNVQLIGREFNEAFNTWATGTGRTHLVSRPESFQR